MDKKYHLTDFGPKPCTASVRDCPIGGEHFNDLTSAWNGYDRKQEAKLIKTVNKKKPRKKMDDDKLVNIVIGGFAGTLFVGTLGGMALSTYNGNVEHNNYATKASQTPYSVSITQHGARYNYEYTGKVTNSHLKQTNFDNCVNSNPKDMKSTITCKTADGKFSIKVDVEYTTKQMNTMIKGTNLTIKDGTRNTNVSNFKNHQNTNNTIFIPNNITK